MQGELMLKKGHLGFSPESRSGPPRSCPLAWLPAVLLCAAVAAGAMAIPCSSAQTLLALAVVCVLRESLPVHRLRLHPLVEVTWQAVFHTELDMV